MINYSFNKDYFFKSSFSSHMYFCKSFSHMDRNELMLNSFDSNVKVCYILFHGLFTDISTFIKIVC